MACLRRVQKRHRGCKGAQRIFYLCLCRVCVSPDNYSFKCLFSQQGSEAGSNPCPPEAQSLRKGTVLMQGINSPCPHEVIPKKKPSMKRKTTRSVGKVVDSQDYEINHQRIIQVYHLFSEHLILCQPVGGTLSIQRSCQSDERNGTYIDRLSRCHMAKVRLTLGRGRKPCLSQTGRKPCLSQTGSGKLIKESFPEEVTPEMNFKRQGKLSQIKYWG